MPLDPSYYDARTSGCATSISPHESSQKIERSSILLETSNKLVDMQEHTNGLIGVLEKQLRIVLSPPPPSPDMDKASKEIGTTSELHERLINAIHRQVGLNMRLQELIDRIAL